MFAVALARHKPQVISHNIRLNGSAQTADDRDVASTDRMITDRTGVGLAVAVALLATLLTLAPVGAPLRALGGLALGLFLPGYCLSLAVVPRRSLIDGRERAVLSVALSIAISIGAGVAIAAMGHRIPRQCGRPAAISIALAGGAAFPADPEARIARTSFPRFPVAALAVVLSVAVLVAAAAWLYSAETPDRYTELRVDGRGAPRPSVVIANHEREARRYSFVVTVRGRQTRPADIALDDGDTARLDVGVVDRGDRVVVEVFAAGGSRAYRTVSFSAS